MRGDSDDLLRAVVPDVQALERLIIDKLTPILFVVNIRSSFALKPSEVRDRAARSEPQRVQQCGRDQRPPVATGGRGLAGTPEAGIAAMRKLVQVDGVQAILTLYTNVVTAQIPLAEQVNVPFLCTVETDALRNKSPYAFQHAATISNKGRLFAAYRRATKVKKIYGLVVNNSAGPFFSAIAKGGAAQCGATYEESSYMTNRRGATRPAPYIGGVIESGLTFDPRTGRQFVTAYRAKTGIQPTYQAGEQYEIIKMFALAIGRSSYNGEAIRNGSSRASRCSRPGRTSSRHVSRAGVASYSA
jgi:hypothetical protein